jgi:hypothetical protein
MAKSVRAGSFYRITGRGLFDMIGGILHVGDIVQVVNPMGGRTRGPLRHVMNERGAVTLCNIHFLERVPAAASPRVIHN